MELLLVGISGIAGLYCGVKIAFKIFE